MKLAGILLELRLQPLEQREGVGGRAREAADHVARSFPPFASRRTLRALALTMVWPIETLAVRRQWPRSALADRQDGGAVPGVGGVRWSLHGGKPGEGGGANSHLKLFMAAHAKGAAAPR